VATQPVQTNEVRRSWTLLPGLLAAAEGEVDVVELGPSAGLNLLFDRWRYRYAAGTWGREDAPLALDGKEHGRVPRALLARQLAVRRRLGIDRNPLDVTSEHGALLLQSFVWADDEERLARVRTAIAEARRSPPEIVRGDFVELLPELLRELERPTIVFNTVSLEYVEPARRERLARTIRAAPVAWVSRELTGRRYVLSLDRTPLAFAHHHGAWLDWIA
jgi:hypothetical protein